MEINARLKRLRAVEKITQKELASILDVSVESIRRWETGKSTPSLTQAVVLERVFGLRAVLWVPDSVWLAAAARASQIGRSLS